VEVEDMMGMASIQKKDANVRRTNSGVILYRCHRSPHTPLLGLEPLMLLLLAVIPIALVNILLKGAYLIPTDPTKLQTKLRAQTLNANLSPAVPLPTLDLEEETS
jgi:hypothetical protein